MEFEDLIKGHINEVHGNQEEADKEPVNVVSSEVKDDVVSPVKEEIVKDEVPVDVPPVKEEVKEEINTDADVIDFSSSTKEPEVEKPADVSDPIKEYNINDEFKKAYPNYNSLDEVMTELEELKSNKPNVSNEDLSKIASILTDGEIDWAKMKEIADVKTMDVSSISDRDAYVRGLKLEGYTTEDINDELKVYDSTFNFDEEDAMEGESLANKREKSKLRREVKRYKENLSSLKDKEEYNLPKVDFGSLTGKEKAYQEEVIREQGLIAENWKNQVVSKVSDFKEVVFDLDKGKKYNFKVTDEDLSFIQDSISDTSNLYKPYIDQEKKSFDFKSMRQDLFMARNWKTVVSSLIKQNANNKAEEVLKDLNNPNFEGSAKSGGQSASNAYDAVAKAMMEGR